MKKYKLIKEYPGSPKLGSIYKEQSAKDFQQRRYIPVEVKYQEDCLWSLERYSPEYWKEVVEKEYEILSFIQDSSGEIWIQDKKQGYGFWSKNGFITSPYITETILGNPYYSIHSVKRLSDGEVFTIGDKIGDYSYSYEIKSLHITDQYKGGVSIEVTIGGYLSIVDIKKTKQKLFTTEDGVDRYAGDQLWYVFYLSDYSLNSLTLVNSNFTSTDNVKYFSTKEKAEEYIIRNKPVLTYNEIIGFYNNFHDSNAPFYSTLHELVKSKLKIK